MTHLVAGPQPGHGRGQVLRGGGAPGRRGGDLLATGLEAGRGPFGGPVLGGLHAPQLARALGTSPHGRGEVIVVGVGALPGTTQAPTARAEATLPPAAPPAGAAAAQRLHGGCQTLPVDGLARHVVEETGGWHGVGRAPGRAHGGAGEVEALAGAGEGHVGQAPLLGELGLLCQGAGVGEGAVLHAGDEDDRELQAFGGVDGHEGDLALFLGLPGVFVLQVGAGRELVGVGHE